jgi:hypothetical protein
MVEMDRDGQRQDERVDWLQLTDTGVLKTVETSPMTVVNAAQSCHPASVHIFHPALPKSPSQENVIPQRKVLVEEKSSSTNGQ